MVVQLGGQAHRSHNQRVEVTGQLGDLKRDESDRESREQKSPQLNPVGPKKTHGAARHLVSELGGLAPGRCGHGINQVPNLLHGGRELLLQRLVSRMWMGEGEEEGLSHKSRQKDYRSH